MIILEKAYTKKYLKEVNENEMNTYFSNANIYSNSTERLLFICMISNISSTVTDLIINLNQIKKDYSQDKNEIRKIYVLHSIYLFLNFINNYTNKNYVNIEENFLKTFCFSKKEIKKFNKLKKIYNTNKILFNLLIFKNISKNFFLSNNKIEFAYIAFYLEEGLNNFINDYNSLNKYSYA